MPPPPTASSANGAQRSKKRRWTREQLLSQLKMIGELEAPLPPTLPPSPPASRAASPAAGFKRKLDSSSDPDAVKRPRTNASLDRAQNQRHPPPPHQSHQSHHQAPQLPPPLPTPIPSTRQLAPPPSHFTSRSEPCEDGEVREDPAVPLPLPSRGSTVDVPIRRPKKGKVSQRYHDMLHDKYHNAGRMLKYSGDARFWSTYPPTHRDYRPLHDPPHPSSPYHKHGGVIARLELVDALVCFTYSIWNRDYARRSCNKDTWSTIEAFLVWCKAKWTSEEGISDAERAFLGLIWMIEGFIQGRKIFYSVRGHLESDVDKVYESMSKKIATAAATAIEGDPVSAASFGILNGKAPPMLPSPSSANSTPVNRDDSTPNGSSLANRPAHAPSRQLPYMGSVPLKLVPQHLREGPAPIPTHVMNAMAAVTESVNPTLLQNIKDMTSEYAASAYCIQSSQQSLNLPILRRCFPNTWARMMHSNLTPTEEHEPDFEDEEGELFWPDQSITGEGIGWLCLMGKAMINEFGKAYGYKGLDGVVPKPKLQAPSDDVPGPSSSSAHPQSHSRTTGGQPPNTRPPSSSGAPR